MMIRFSSIYTYLGFILKESDVVIPSVQITVDFFVAILCKII